MTQVDVRGQCQSEFHNVRDAFAGNFSERGDIGAALAIMVEGEMVVDLWAGHTDAVRSKAWEADTLVNIWSTTKGVVATCFAMLVDRGLITYDTPVAQYWPEFGAAGKDKITVAMLLSHQAGLCGFQDPATAEDFYDLEGSAARLVAAKPLWEPGSRSGYHAITIGFLAAKLCQKVDGRTLKQFIAEELHETHGLDIFIGLPEALSGRAASLIAPENLSVLDPETKYNPSQIAALTNPVMDPLVPNETAWRAAEIPSANGFATARSLAVLYGTLAHDKKINGITLLGQSALDAATKEQISGIDEVLGLDIEWGCGFKMNGNALMGPCPDSFSHGGWGGSFAFADPDRHMGVAYTMNHMGTMLSGDPRNLALIEAIYG